MADEHSSGRVYKTSVEQRRRAAAYAAQHRDERRAYNKKWREENKERLFASLANRRARKRGVGGMHTAEQWLALNESFGWRCLRCDVAHAQSPMTRDHVLPLAQGGTNDIGNIQPLCLRCNLWKNARFIDYRILRPDQHAAAEAALAPLLGYRKTRPTTEQRKKISETLTGYKHPDGARANMARGVRESWLKRGAWKSSKSGVRGVSWDETTNCWIASVTVDGKKRKIGRYRDIDDAARAVALARAGHEVTRQSLRPRGAAHGCAKLDERAVLEIKALLAQSVTQRSIAERFGVSLSTINHIKTGRLWTHIGKD